jgi:hypothetical protein
MLTYVTEMSGAVTSNYDKAAFSQYRPGTTAFLNRRITIAAIVSLALRASQPQRQSIENVSADAPPRRPRSQILS